MLAFHLILAAGALLAFTLKPRAPLTLAAISAAAAVDLLVGASLEPALGVLPALIAFLGAALTLAGIVSRSGLNERLASALASVARGNLLLLYCSVCALCALATALVSLDGAVVLLVPIVLTLGSRFRVPTIPLFLGVVVVANVASLAVPEGNPTNIVVIERLRLSPGGFLTHMFVPGLVAAILCATAVALSERRALEGGYDLPPAGRGTPLCRDEREAALSLALASIAAWGATLLGIAPWWPFAGAVAICALLIEKRPQPTAPWRMAAQLGALLIVIGAVGVRLHLTASSGLVGLLALAGALGAASALANNLPVSASAISLLAPGRSAYAAAIGLAAGSLGTPQGSVATLIASELGGDRCASALSVRMLAPLALSAVASATLLLWFSL